MALPLDVTVKGQALNSFGFTAENTIAGLGLNTWGYLWPCQAIWSPGDYSITTTWVDCIGNSGNIEICTD